jgi:hypothetical protein
MIIPFTTEQLLNVFEQYNVTVWPGQLAILLLGLLAILLAWPGNDRFSRISSLILSLLWLWMGLIFHLIYFRRINQAGSLLFGTFFILQAAIFICEGVLNSRLRFHFQADIYGLLGVLFFIYTLIIYPLLGYLLGHQYPAMPTFGLPCPTTIFTFGLLLWATREVPLYILAIPFGWAVVGFNAATSLKIMEDFGLLMAALPGSLLIIIRKYAH